MGGLLFPTLNNVLSGDGAGGGKVTLNVASCYQVVKHRVASHGKALYNRATSLAACAPTVWHVHRNGS